MYTGSNRDPPVTSNKKYIRLLGIYTEKAERLAKIEFRRGKNTKMYESSRKYKYMERQAIHIEKYPLCKQAKQVKQAKGKGKSKEPVATCRRPGLRARVKARKRTKERVTRDSKRDPEREGVRV